MYKRICWKFQSFLPLVTLLDTRKILYLISTVLTKWLSKLKEKEFHWNSNLKKPKIKTLNLVSLELVVKHQGLLVLSITQRKRLKLHLMLKISCKNSRSNLFRLFLTMSSLLIQEKNMMLRSTLDLLQGLMHLKHKFAIKSFRIKKRRNFWISLELLMELKWNLWRTLLVLVPLLSTLK